MVTVSLYLAIKVIQSPCYAVDLFRITPTVDVREKTFPTAISVCLERLC